MGVSVDEGGGGGRRSVNADLNLVPYIDLLMCMVSFLLITAVWSQLARLEVKQQGEAQAADLEPPDEFKHKISVVVGADGFRVVVDDEAQAPIPATDGAYDTALQTRLQDLKSQFPDKSDIKVASEDAIQYETLVRTMDAAVSAKFPDVSLLDVASSGL